MTDSKPEPFLTLFEQERGYAFTRSALFFNASDLPPLAARMVAIAKAEDLSLADAADRVAPSTFDEAADHYTCTYDLRKALVRYVERQRAAARAKAAKQQDSQTNE